MATFHKWIAEKNWKVVYESKTVDEKVERFQQILVDKYLSIFPVKELKVSGDDKPWFSTKLKTLDRKRRREFERHKKSSKWKNLNEEFLQAVKQEKSKYYKTMVEDLKVSNPRMWYSKVKRMGGKEDGKEKEVYVEEISESDNETQANIIADFFAETRNLFEPIDPSDFKDYFSEDSSEDLSEILVSPSKVIEVIRNMNKKVHQ